MELIQKKLSYESRVVEALVDIIMGDDLPIHIEIGRCNKGMIQVLIEYSPENEVVYCRLIENVTTSLYPL